jgi:hypothetical protein
VPFDLAVGECAARRAGWAKHPGPLTNGITYPGFFRTRIKSWLSYLVGEIAIRPRSNVYLLDGTLLNDFTNRLNLGNPNLVAF